MCSSDVCLGVVLVKQGRLFGQIVQDDGLYVADVLLLGALGGGQLRVLRQLRFGDPVIIHGGQRVPGSLSGCPTGAIPAR
jgi:hypothetical protein